MAVLKYFLLHEDTLVRDSVGFHLYESWSRDTGLIPLVVEACERFGELPVLHLLGFACRFPMSHRGIEATLGALERSHPPFAEQWIATAPLELVAARDGLVSDALSSHALSRLTRRLRFQRAPLTELWGRLESLASKLDAGRAERGDWDEADDLVEALAGREPSRTLLERLHDRREVASLHRALFDVELAGAMELHEATPRLLHLLEHEADALADAAAGSLARLANPGTIRLVRERYPSGSWRFRLYALSVLKAVKLDVAEKALRSLLTIESEPALRGRILDALRFHFSSRSLSALREELRRPTSIAPEEELKKAVFVLARVLGLSDPEAERWRRSWAPGVDDEVLFWFPAGPRG